MKLEYKILWFDDQPHNVDSTEDGLKTRLARMGFKLEVQWVDKIGDIGSLISRLRSNIDFDLILVDWDLGPNSIDGAQLAKHLRKNFKTDIIFYSSEAPKKLRKLIFDNDVDGVFCIRRENLVAETLAIINYSIKKIIDLNHMRGIVMSAVSDFDKIIEKSLNARYQQLSDVEKYSFIKQIIEKMTSVCDANKKQIENLSHKECCIDELLAHRAFSSSLKQQILVRILEKKKDDETISFLFELLQKYNEQVIKPRNQLAHAIPALQNGRKVLLIDDKEYTDIEFCNLRVNLLSHEDNLTDILQAIMAGVLHEAI
ncbi:hypothetical protein CRN79_16750 [Serratia fonticola]|uniref:response regulator n=1 Tax=Serratia fonticola TaxID=47917 RepID=UPI000BFDD943|nr:response regulator [Serratia fonticola]ATM77389.1 hypothetical protein CRN79_16750 [Serratia fonticola]